LLISKIIKLFINLICELIVSGFMSCVSNPTNCGVQFAWTGDKRFTNYNWATRTATVYTARPTFSLLDICISFSIGPNLKYYWLSIRIFP